jgi:hypothetical protein
MDSKLSSPSFHSMQGLREDNYEEGPVIYQSLTPTGQSQQTISKRIMLVEDRRKFAYVFSYFFFISYH